MNITVIELSDDRADVQAWYVNGRKVYDYHDPYIDELLRAIFMQPEFDNVTFESRGYKVDSNHQLPDTFDAD